jgi:hypothetical protein
MISGNVLEKKVLFVLFRTACHEKKQARGTQQEEQFWRNHVIRHKYRKRI